MIAELARARCINAISCMAASRTWNEDAKLLAGVENIQCGALGRIQVGLHLVLASETPITTMSCVDAEGRLPSADRLLAMVLTERIDWQEFAAEIDRQFVAFRAARGRPPDFVDAHQHVHVYPALRDLVISAAQRYAPNAWIRVPADRIGAMVRRPFLAKAIGSSVQAWGLRANLVRSGVRANLSFAGHYDFGTGFADYLPSFFKGASSRHLIMCHPGASDLADDVIGQSRVIEADVIGQLDLETRLAKVSMYPVP